MLKLVSDRHSFAQRTVVARSVNDGSEACAFGEDFADIRRKICEKLRMHVNNKYSSRPGQAEGSIAPADKQHFNTSWRFWVAGRTILTVAPWLHESLRL